jgi:hypothetical protein
MNPEHPGMRIAWNPVTSIQIVALDFVVTSGGCRGTLTSIGALDIAGVLAENLVVYDANERAGELAGESTVERFLRGQKKAGAVDIALTIRVRRST